jgi:hypothetical protein
MSTKTVKSIKIKTDKSGKVRVVPKMTGTLNQQYASKNRKRYRGAK